MSKSLAKLDHYHYNIVNGEIHISILGNTDPILVDIMSEIEFANGNIYVDGNYYVFTDYHILNGKYGDKYLVLQVVNAN